MRLFRNLTMCLALAVILPTAVLGQDDSGEETGPLDKPVSVTLSNASMGEAIAAVAKAAGVAVFGPTEPAEGITLFLDRQPLRTALDVLAGTAQVRWDTVGEAIVFVKPHADGAPRDESTSEPLTLQQKAAALVSSLDGRQMYALSSGSPLAYSDLDAYQRELLASILSPPTIGFSADGEVMRNLPAPEGTSISFWTLPYLVVPAAQGTKAITMRLDSTPFVELREAVAQ